jgi:hypothetical protein
MSISKNIIEYIDNLRIGIHELQNMSNPSLMFLFHSVNTGCREVNFEK